MTKISRLNKIAPTELGVGCQNPECLRGWFLEKNIVLTDANQGLRDSEPIKAFRTSDIVANYRLKDEVIRHAAPVDFVIFGTWG